MEINQQNKLINILGITFIGLLIVLTYKTTFIWMYGRYTGIDSYYSHGFLVPLVTIYFIFIQREHFIRAERYRSFSGLIIIVFSLIVHILGISLYIFAISGLSLFFLIVGLSIYFFGIKKTQIIWFPLLFLIFMIPIPMAIIEIVSFPLKIFAAKAGVWIVSQFNVPVLREGFNIFIPEGHLLVGNPCSGLRSLISFLCIGAVVAYIAQISVKKKIFLFLITIPIAVLSNIARIPILILVSHYKGLEAAAPDTFVHTGSGIMVFVIGFLLLLSTERILQCRKSL